MKLGEVIRKYRKEKQMTQEEMAGYLGVSAPAVNKWENGNSYPDITLLAPIARLLGIRTDTLLSYEEELGEVEIRRILIELSERIKKESYEAGFVWAVKQMQKYPNCEELILGTAQTLEGFRIIMGIEAENAHNEEIEKIYRRLQESADAKIAQRAKTALVQHYMMEEKLDQAQEVLDQLEISADSQWQNKLQAVIYRKQGKVQEAYTLFERSLLESAMEISWSLQGLSALASEAGDLAEARALINKQEKMAEIMELGEWMSVSPGLGFAIERRDTEECLRVLEKLIDNINQVNAFQNAKLYRHMKFNKNENTNIFFMLRKSFEMDKTIDFLRDDPRFQELWKKLREMEEKTQKND